jgi:DNA-binding response OmpR family regulator
LKRIVIIEDNAMAANIYQSTLSRQGFSVEVATDGELGLAAVVGSPPDLILLDLMLPKIDGAELLRRIRATETLATVPIIVISNAYTPARLDSIREAGATKIVSKANMSPKQLVSIVGEFIQA